MNTKEEYYADERRWVKGLFAGFIAVFLTLWFGVSVYGMTSGLLIRKNGTSTWGIVSKVERIVTGESEGLRFDVTFRYKENVYQTYNRVLASDSIYQVGEQVRIKFMPNNPERAIIDSTSESYSGYLIFFLIGGLVLWGAVHVFRKM